MVVATMMPSSVLVTSAPVKRVGFHVRADGGRTADFGTLSPFWTAGRAAIVASQRSVAATGAMWRTW